MMSNGAPSSHFIPVKQEQDDNPEIYLHTPPYGNSSPPFYVGAVRTASHQGLQFPTAFPFPNTASSGAFCSTAMPPKRNNLSEGNGGGGGPPPAKHLKVEDPEEFSTTVKKKLLSSSRTGQACDRCKVRKIRCDGLPGGCSPCLQNNTECRTTDRITGRATQRGYVQELEQQVQDMQVRVRELEQQLQAASNNDNPPTDYHNGRASSYNHQPGRQWSITPSSYTAQSNTARHADGSLLPPFPDGIIGDSYLGLSPAHENITSIKGTVLSILGMEIDVAGFESADIDEPDLSKFHPQLYNKSYQAFLQSTLNINPRIEKVDLPPRQDGLQFAEWYFRVIHPYVPILHEPALMKMLIRRYDDPSFQPTPAQTVMIHMIFAIMFFQYASRNEDKKVQFDLNKQSNMHYHFSISMFYQLSSSRTLQDVQALALICSHLRNFPKPGPSWMLTQTAMAMAIELGLHRSTNKWAQEPAPSVFEVEMRKRVFWAILAMHVTLSGKLGRPMAFRLDDFDVEPLEPIDDTLLSEENGLDTSTPGTCTHRIGIHAMTMVPLFLEMYSTIYAVRRQPETYIANINTLESKLRQWKEKLPPELVNGDPRSRNHTNKVYALYAQSWTLEFRLLLRHPAVSMTNDRKFNEESMRVCVETSRHLLSVVRQMQKFKSLDTTWYNCAVYVMAITTTLFAQWEKRSETSAADLAALREEMDIWLDIMGDLGTMLGAGNRLQEAVRNVTNGTLGLLNKSLANKTPSFVTNEHTKTLPQRPNSNPETTYPNHQEPYNSASTTTINSAPAGYAPTEGQLAQQPTPYQGATQYPGYSADNASAPTTLAYTPRDPHSYTDYNNSTADSSGAPLLAALATEEAQNQSGTENWQNPQQNMDHNSGSQAWQQWTDSVTENGLNTQDCYSASALMQLGGRGDMPNRNNTNSGMAQQPMGEMNGGQSVMDHHVGRLGGHQVDGVTWPSNIYSMPQGGQ